jgi:tripartite-type tricarboxylate transporter receptor subunit TctC
MNVFRKNTSSLFAAGLMLLGLLAGAAQPSYAQADAYPSKPIRIIASTSPGGVTDMLARTLGQLIGEAMGQSVIVENKPGAGTFIGMSACAKAAADGYTLCITDNQSLVYNPLLFTKLPYDPDHDFVPVGTIARSNGGVILAHSSVAASSFKEMIAYARENPGAVNFATWGPGSIPAIYYSWITRQNDVQITAVPYKGAGPSFLAITSGQVQLAYGNVGIAKPLLDAGKLKILAMTGSRRHPAYPNVPSLGELNSDPATDTYFGIYAPARTPAAIVKRLNAEMAKALKSARFQATARDNSLEPLITTPEEFATMLQGTRANAARVFNAIGIKPTDAPADAPTVSKP